MNRPEPFDRGFIYAVQCGRFIKIGFTTKNPSHRIGMLKFDFTAKPWGFWTGIPGMLIVRGVRQALQMEEGYLHRKLRQAPGKHLGEWFKVSPELLRLLGDLQWQMPEEFGFRHTRSKYIRYELMKEDHAQVRALRVQV